MYISWIQIVDLNQVICNYKKGKNILDNFLSIQRYVNDKSGIGFYKVKTSCQKLKRLSLSKLAILVTMFNLEKYVIICIIERFITRIISIIIKDA